MAERSREKRAEAERRLRLGREELIARGVEPQHADEALALADGSIVRAEAELHVAFDRYRTEEERSASSGWRVPAETVEHSLASASLVLFGISPWLGGEPKLALEALHNARVGGVRLEAAVHAIVEIRRAEFAQECSQRLDAAIASGGVAEGSSRSAAASEEVPDAEEWPTPLCCRTHHLELQSLAAERSRGPALSPSEASELKQLHAASDGDAWLVLVGGEHGGIMRADARATRPGPFLAGHCSLEWVGFAYSRLKKFFGRDRIIVIAQLAETLEWLREASVDEASAARLAGRPSLLAMLRRRSQVMQDACKELLEDGGADYDGIDVNASTLLRVLKGDPSGKGRCVPQHAVGSTMLVLVSHGHAHPAGPSTTSHEWYMHFPHPVPVEADNLYDFVSHQGFEDVDPHPEWDWGAPKYRWKLYSQILFQAHHTVLQRSPRRRLVLFHQFCLSGGAANFMRQRSYQTYCGTKRWPVFAIVTAGRFEAALGNFVGLWIDELVSALDEGGSRTLGDVYKAAEQRYWGASPDVRASNAAVAAQRADARHAESPLASSMELTDAGSPELEETEPSTVGTVGRVAGFDATSGESMENVPVGRVTNIV
mmetsp:Transcript_137954/g.440607  ORF Transcript_137954/g.440607 Transcript_137954/m.440607 type:complete len:601 (+) Transcript_137954:891-2693(+)